MRREQATAPSPLEALPMPTMHQRSLFESPLEYDRISCSRCLQQKDYVSNLRQIYSCLLSLHGKAIATGRVHQSDRSGSSCEHGESRVGGQVQG